MIASDPLVPASVVAGQPRHQLLGVSVLDITQELVSLRAAQRRRPHSMVISTSGPRICKSNPSAVMAEL